MQVNPDRPPLEALISFWVLYLLTDSNTRTTYIETNKLTTLILPTLIQLTLLFGRRCSCRSRSSRASAPGVRTPNKRVHNTSALLAKQLVLELKLRMLLRELSELLPCSVTCRTPNPLNQHLPVAAVQPGANSLGWSRKNSAVVDRRQLDDLRRWCTHVLLQEHHMEDGMNAGTRRQLQLVGHRTDALQNAIRPIESRC